MLYGMGVVFVFLTVLIFATAGMSNVVQKWFPHVEEPTPTRKPRAAVAGAQAVSEQTLKIIKAAIDQHRGR